MTVNILVFIFFGLFFLFLIESIYFLKKKLSLGPQVANKGEGGGSGKLVLMGGLAIIVLLIVSFGFLFLSREKTSSPKLTEAVPTQVPTQPPTPTLTEIVYTFPTVTEAPSSPTVTSTPKSSPTKTPTPTKRPSGTPTLSPTPKKPSPTVTTAPPIGGPEILNPATTATPTLGVVIEPKLPVAGSIEQTIILFLLAISSVVVGLIL